MGEPLASTDLEKDGDSRPDKTRIRADAISTSGEKTPSHGNLFQGNGEQGHMMTSINSYPRSRRGQKKSKPTDNAEGLKEKDLRRRRDQDTVASCKYKKRHRKDLTAEEIEQIVEATKVPFRLYKDIAKQFKVSIIQVNNLVKESKQQPEKLEAKRQRAKLDEERREAIEDVVTKMLSINRPIVAAKQVQEAVQK